jgi:hypothetical protein
MGSPLKLSKDEVAAFRQKLTDRSWAVLAMEGDYKGAIEERDVGPLFVAAKDFDGLAEAICPCFIVGHGNHVRGIFLENPNMTQVLKFSAVTTCHVFVTNKGYTDDDGKDPEERPLDYQWLEVGEVASPIFENGYFVVAFKYKEEKQGNGLVAVLAEKLVAFKIPSLDSPDP